MYVYDYLPKKPQLMGGKCLALIRELTQKWKCIQNIGHSGESVTGKEMQLLLSTLAPNREGSRPGAQSRQNNPGERWEDLPLPVPRL